MARAKNPLGKLSKDDKMLVVLRDELYGGAWREMLDDLLARLDHKPFIFKLAHRIESDIARIRRLQSMESKNRVNLADVIRSGGRP